MASDFQVKLDKFIAAADAKLAGLTLALSLEALARLKQLTPVDTGNLRASWTVLKDDQYDYRIVTNVVYARRVNYGFTGFDSKGRYYNQPGRHMVEHVIAELPALADQVVARLT